VVKLAETLAPPTIEADDVHAWQLAQASRVAVQPGALDVALVAACDVAYSKDDAHAFAATVVVERDTWKEIERSTWTGPVPAAYEPGRFSVREAACLLPTLEALATRPDVLLIDGHGRAHPRRFGLACHLGLAFDIASVGCAKSVLVGTPAVELGDLSGSSAELVHDGEVVGALVRTCTGVKPVCASPGHRFDVATSAALVAALAPEFRIPEPLRQAHHASIELRAAASP